MTLFSGQQPQQPGAPPQQDYTKAWEEYYKKQGELRASVALGDLACNAAIGLVEDVSYDLLSRSLFQTAQVATGAGPAAPPGPQPDYSAAWAEYYRQQAAYYGQTPGAGGPVPPPTQQGQQVSCRTMAGETLLLVNNVH